LQLSASSGVHHEGSRSLRTEVAEGANDVSDYQAVAFIPSGIYRLTDMIVGLKNQ
jgi:hypothetical protein